MVFIFNHIGYSDIQIFGHSDIRIFGYLDHLFFNEILSSIFSN